MIGTRRLYAAIHVRRAKHPGLEDDAAWRAFLEQCTGKRSLREMDGTQLGAVLDALHNRADPRPAATPIARKCVALWLTLYNLGLVDNPSRRALSAFVRSQTGIDDLAWLKADQADKVIEALKGMAARAGYRAAKFHAESRTPGEGSFKPGLIEAQWARLAALDAFRPGAQQRAPLRGAQEAPHRGAGAHARLDTWLAGIGFPVAAPQFLDEAQSAEVIATLGKWIRRLVTRAKAEAAGDAG